MTASNAESPSTATRQTRNQERAKAAWEATPAADDLSDEYRSLVRGAGASIMTMGLGQTLSFYLAKGQSHHERLADALARWLLEDVDADGEALIETIMQSESSEYRRLTTEALAYLTWLKRFAEARS